MYEVLRRRNGGYESSQIDREHFYVLRYLTLLSKFIELLYIVWVHWLGVWGARGRAFLVVHDCIWYALVVLLVL